MGAWGTGPFDNDDAQDFVLDLADAPERELTQWLADALSLPDGYVEAPEGATAVAAAALVAIGAGMPAPSSPTVADFISARTMPASPQLREAARTALARLSAPESELQELWNEAGQEGEVMASYEVIRRAL